MTELHKSRPIQCMNDAPAIGRVRAKGRPGCPGPWGGKLPLWGVHKTLHALIIQHVADVAKNFETRQITTDCHMTVFRRRNENRNTIWWVKIK